MDVPDLSGRFAGSCTNVGIVPAYLAGIDVDELLGGLKAGYETFGPETAIHENPGYCQSTYLFSLYKGGFRNVFSMVYSRWLEGAVGLFVQEISESSGKNGKGILGTSQQAPICQHSVLELLLGGASRAFHPSHLGNQKQPRRPSIAIESRWFRRKNGLDVIRYQNDATFEALLSRGLPAGKISLGDPSTESIGQLVAFIQSMVYYLCLLLDVNWTDNPMVLIGKQICNEAMAQNFADDQRKANREKVAEEKFSASTFFR